MFEPRYPKFKYHKDQGALIVHSAEEEKSLGRAWRDSPADFEIETHPMAQKTEIAYDIKGQPYERPIAQEGDE